MTAPVPPDLPMTMKVYSSTGAFIQEFPWFTTLSVLDVINDVGSFTFNWRLNSPGAANLISDTALQMAVCMDRRDNNGFQEVARYLYEQDTYDQSMNESAIVQASGRSIVAILEQGVVYPQGGLGSTTTSYSFTGASPGAMMHALITAAQARGCFPSLGMSFTSGQDSSGNPWIRGFTNSFDAGTSLLSVLTSLAQGGLVDFNMTGTTLNMYNPGTTLATDRSHTIFLRRGAAGGIETIPAQRDRTQIGTTMLAIGDNGLNLEVVAPTLATLGRYERYLSQSGVTDSSTLSYWATQALAAIDDQQFSYIPSYICDVNKGTPVPWKDYFPGDYISIDLTGSPVKFRASQITVQCGVGGPTQVEPTLNDVFYDRNILLQNKLNAVSGGTVTGIGNPISASGPNPTVPGVPAFVPANIYTAAYFSPATGTTLAQVELNWTTPLNSDGTVMIDGSQYIIQYKLSTTPIYPLAWSQLQGKPWSSINGNPWTNPLATPQNTQWTTVQVPIDNNTLIISGLICGETYDFQIACSDVSGNTGLFSATTALATASDNVAPAQPDAPTVSASMVAVQVMSDLGSATGGTYNLDRDLDHLEVHYSYDPSFVPVSGVGSPTYLGKLIANAGMMQAQIAAVGTFQVTSTTGIFIKLIAVDETGNTSVPSPGSGVTAVLIDDSHISSLSVSKLVAGTVSATIVLGGTIATALSGPRAVMDSTGFHTFDAAGNKIFDVSDTTPVITLGQNSGANSITLDTSMPFPTLFFNVPGNGSTSAFINAVGSVVGDATRIGINSGQYTSTIDSTAAYQRLFLAGLNGIQLGIVDVNQVLHGVGIGGNDGSTYMSLSEHGTEIGGLHSFLDNTVTPNEVYWQLNGYFQDEWTTANPVANSGLFFGAANGLSAGTAGISNVYGPTMRTTPRVMAQYSCGTATPVMSLNVDSLSPTGFGVGVSGSAPATFSILFHGFRTR